MAVFDHVGMSVSDLDRSIEFYRTCFDMEVVFLGPFEGERYEQIMRLRGAKGRVAALRNTSSPSFQIEMFEFSYPEPAASQVNRPVCDHGITHFCVEVDDVDFEYARLVKFGVKFHCSPLTFQSGNRATYGRDPDGNVFELWQKAQAGQRR